MTDLDIALPADLDAERSVLGALMWDQRLLDQVAQIITGPAFYNPAHELVFNAITALVDNGQPADVITVANHLRERGELDRAGGQLALVDMYGTATPVAANVIAHARIVATHAIRRQTIDTATRMKQLALASGDPHEMIAQAQATLDTLGTPTTTRALSAADVITDLAASIGTRDFTGLPTPWADLNRSIGGMQGSRLYCIGARPGVGKSLMVQNLAEHWVSRHQLPVLLVSCEMPAREIGMRMLSHQARINHTSLKTGQLTPSELTRLEVAIDATAEPFQMLDIVDGSNLTVADIRTHARALVHEHGRVGLVLVDYLQLLTPPAGGGRDRTREREVASMSRQLKKLAMELDCPVVVASQLNRAMTGRADKKPTLTDLRESGAIEQDCDVVLLMHAPDEDQHPNEIEVIVAKNRDGQQGTCELIRQGWFSRLVSDTTARQETQE